MMPLLVERKLFKIGEGGFALTLPKAWINYHRLKPGDKVEVIFSAKAKPTRDWMRKVFLGQSKARIRRWLRHEEQKKNTVYM